MAQVIIISNRLPVSVKKEAGKLIYSAGPGGLATGLSSFIKDRRNKWIGWPGLPADDLTEREKHQITSYLAKQNCLPVFLTQKQIDDFYSGYSNTLLWPLFHNLPMDDSTAHARWWRAYKSVNESYAEATAEIAQPTSTIWVQDYQLLLLPEILRSQLPEAQVGFFLHIPFPSVKFFNKLPEAKRLIKGMLGAELIGFHTTGYVKNFLLACQEFGLGIPGDGQLIIGARTIRVTDFPMGIDYDKFASARKLPAVKKAVREYKKKYKGLKIIASADRLDISKGFVERLEAYKQFLEQNPKQLGKVVFVLVGAPSRTDVVAYQKLGEKVQALAKEINQRFGSPSWQPVDYINVAIPFENVSALFQLADVAFIAPLRDGMNLTAKEFVASNQNKGVLILSKTAGAAEELHDALLVNPRRPASSVDALQQALSMPKRQLRKRLKVMRKQVATHTVHTWAKSFVTSLQEPIVTPSIGTRSLTDSMASTIIRRYNDSHRRLLVLDYDHLAMSASKQATLHQLCNDPNNEVVLASGHSPHELDTKFAGLRLSLIAENGAQIRDSNNEQWEDQTQTINGWETVVSSVMKTYAKLTPGATIEHEANLFVWDYSNAPAYYAQKYSTVLKRELRQLQKRYGITFTQTNKVITVTPDTLNRGIALKRWLTLNHDYILCIGASYNDEAMFAALPQNAQTIKVGAGKTAARYRIADVEAAQTLLAQIMNESLTSGSVDRYASPDRLPAS